MEPSNLTTMDPTAVAAWATGALLALGTLGVAAEKAFGVLGRILWALINDRVAAAIEAAGGALSEAGAAADAAHAGQCDTDRRTLKTRVAALEEESSVTRRQIDGDPSTDALGLREMVRRLDAKVDAALLENAAGQREVLAQLTALRTELGIARRDGGAS